MHHHEDPLPLQPQNPDLTRLRKRQVRQWRLLPHLRLQQWLHLRKQFALVWPPRRLPTR
jgi:hypothetical protein